MITTGDVVLNAANPNIYYAWTNEDLAELHRALVERGDIATVQGFVFEYPVVVVSVRLWTAQCDASGQRGTYETVLYYVLKERRTT